MDYTDFWMKEDYDTFKTLICLESICIDCKECSMSVRAISECFNILIFDTLIYGSNSCIKKEVI